VSHLARKRSLFAALSHEVGEKVFTDGRASNSNRLKGGDTDALELVLRLAACVNEMWKVGFFE
jgi:hypothetical protein